ncbi:MAG: flagellar biosynthesis protein FliQ [Thermodesulfovibrionales bacterium]|nr:flagellar biosynthesis protein FliQ [Thermodesulfovibrionales bacterium]
MTAELLEQLSRQTFETIILVGGPVLIVSLVVGITISLFQAITQLQEMTIAFIPKIIAIFATVFLALPWMINVMIKFTKGIIENIPTYVR